LRLQTETEGVPPVLSLYFLGETRIELDGEVLELPPSRKTRGLLAYLAVTGRAHRRDRLCSLLWDLPDDPRGALRWSLSKLRRLVDEPTRHRILTQGDAIRFDGADVHVDILDLRRRALLALETGNTGELALLAEGFAGEFLADNNLLDCHEFHTWCIAECAELQSLHLRVLRSLAQSSRGDPEAALTHARTLLQIEPHDESAWTGLIGLLSATGRRREAREQATLAGQVLKQAGVSLSGALPKAVRELNNVPSHPKPTPAAAFDGNAALAYAPLETGEPEAAEVPRFQAITDPGKPTIVVVPFKCIGHDNDHQIFADGVTEELTTMLSRILGLFLIARDSAFQIKDRAACAMDAARKLGARYALHGSVQIAADRIRVHAYLLDSESGIEMWSERYDVPRRDVFSVQDEISTNVVRALQVELLDGEQARIWHHSTTSLEAWSCLTQGLSHYRRQTKDGVLKARAMFERATEMDPSYASAWAWLAYAHWHDARFLWAADPQAALARASRIAKRARALDPSLPEVHGVLAVIRVLRGQFDEAIAAARRGVALEPSGPENTALLAFVLVWAGEAEEAARTTERAIAYCPLHSPWYLDTLGHAQFLLRQHERAVASYREAIVHLPDYVMPRIGLAACYAEMGRLVEAREQAREVMRIWPDFSVEQHTGMSRYRLPAHAERRYRALKAAGLP
jgi:TolB-like protein/DNA-binding SARP family transcriptional activator